MRAGRLVAAVATVLTAVLTVGAIASLLTTVAGPTAAGLILVAGTVAAVTLWGVRSAGDGDTPYW